MTTTLLIEDLENAKTYNFDIIVEIDNIIELAKNGTFHDFRSQVATPKILLFEKLRTIGLNEMADKTINGDYDDDM